MSHLSEAEVARRAALEKRKTGLELEFETLVVSAKPILKGDMDYAKTYVLDVMEFIPQEVAEKAIRDIVSSRCVGDINRAVRRVREVV